MLTLHSFLQSVVLFVKALAVKVKKEQYRTFSVVMAGAVVIAIVTFGANGFGGSGRNGCAQDPGKRRGAGRTGRGSGIWRKQLCYGSKNTIWTFKYRQ